MVDTAHHTSTMSATLPVAWSTGGTQVTRIHGSLVVIILVCAFADSGCGDNPTEGDGGLNDGTVGRSDLAAPTDSTWMSDDGPIQIRDGGITITDDGGTFTCFVTSCAGKVVECGDCLDNDGD